MSIKHSAIIDRYLLLTDIEREAEPAQRLVLQFPDFGTPTATIGVARSLVGSRRAVAECLSDMIEEAVLAERTACAAAIRARGEG